MEDHSDTSLYILPYAQCRYYTENKVHVWFGLNDCCHKRYRGPLWTKPQIVDVFAKTIQSWWTQQKSKKVKKNN
jgi:hypothetical protein